MLPPALMPMQRTASARRDLHSWITDQLRPVLEHRQVRSVVVGMLLVVCSIFTVMADSTGIDGGWMFVVPVAISAIAGGLREGLVVALAASVLSGLNIVWSAEEIDAGAVTSLTTARFALYGLTGGFLGAFADAYHAVQSNLRDQARLDPLTRVANVAGFYEHLGTLQARPTRFAMMVVDVDELKALNDAHGHQAGSEAIQAVADILRVVVRSTDCVARFGGDEFVVTLNHAGRLGAEIVVARVHEMLLTHELMHAPGARVTVSAGIAVYGENGTTTEQLLDAADRAMYRNKRAGKVLV